jgi:hypothetical protein
MVYFGWWWQRHGVKVRVFGAAMVRSSDHISDYRSFVGRQETGGMVVRQGVASAADGAGGEAC